MNDQFDLKSYQERMGTGQAAAMGGSSNVVPPEYDPSVSLVKYYNSPHCNDSFCPAVLAEEQPPGYNPHDEFIKHFEESVRIHPHRYNLNSKLVVRKSPDGIIEHPITPWGDAEVLIGHVVYDQHGRLTALYGKPSQQSVHRAVDMAIKRLMDLDANPSVQAAYDAAAPQLDDPVSNDSRVDDRVPPFQGVRLIVSGYDRQPDNLLVCII